MAAGEGAIVSDYGQSLLLGEMQKQAAPVRGRYVNKYGANLDIDTATTPEILWTVGGMYSWPSTATAMEIYSASTADRSPSTGARTITVQGIGSSAGSTQSETVTLNGQSAVNLVNPFYRVNRLIVATAGTNGSNVGIITVRTKTGGTTHCNIVAGEGQTLIAHWTVPVNKRARVRKVWAQFPDATNQSNAQLRLRFRSGSAINTKHVFSINTTLQEYAFDWPIGGPEAPALADIYIEVVTVAGNNTQIQGGFDVSIEDA